MLKRHKLAKTNRLSRVTLIVVAIAVAALGTYLLTSSRAASSYASTNASQGTLDASGKASVQSCSGSSAGPCVVFGGTSQAAPFIGMNDLNG